MNSPFPFSPRQVKPVLLALTLQAFLPLSAPASPPPLEPARTKVDGEEMFTLGFDRLSAFEYMIVDAGTGATPEEIEAARKRDQVPPWIRLYHEKRVVLTGYLMPLAMENGRTKKFVMMKDVNTCCYGAVPNMNDYVVVTMKGEGITPVQDVPVLLVGIFRVAEKYDGSYVTSLFEMEGEKFLGARK
jgi:hypothetical protein